MTDPTHTNGLVKMPVYENGGFYDEQALPSNLENGVIVTTRLQKVYDEDDADQNNVGFERLPDEGNKLGVMLMSIRTYLIDMITKYKVLYKKIVFQRLICGYFLLDFYWLWIESFTFNWLYNLFFFCYE